MQGKGPWTGTRKEVKKREKFSSAEDVVQAKSSKLTFTSARSYFLTSVSWYHRFAKWYSEKYLPLLPVCLTTQAVECVLPYKCPDPPNVLSLSTPQPWSWSVLWAFLQLTQSPVILAVEVVCHVWSNGQPGDKDRNTLVKLKKDKENPTRKFTEFQWSEILEDQAQKLCC